ncbi:MAG: IPT/TIG domain-containing protein [Sphingobacteriaceae bacterium]|nr:IPT/TIG domain-containing protein [Sphingobacteriaceae bacterium]
MIWITFSGCKKDENSHPEVGTLAAEVLSPTRLLLKGDIISKGSFNTTDYGFVYSTSQYAVETGGTKVSLGSDIKEGQFSKEVQNLPFNSSNTIFVRAYLANSNGTVYGPVVSVTLPTISTGTILPASGKPGDLITINGQYHKLTKEELTVTIGGATATIEEVTSSKITVKVPANINTSYSGTNQVMVSVAVGGQAIYSSNNGFTILPTIKDFMPKSGAIGTTIVITGDNIPSYSYYSNTIKVYFGQVLGTVSNYSSSGISVIIPPAVTSAKVPISVEYNRVKTILADELTIIPHTITTISPATALAGSTFSIFGSYFPNNSYYGTTATVTIGNIPVSVSYYSSGQLNATIPSNLPAGDYKVAVTSGPFTVEAPQTLKVQALTVSGFSPTSGGVGREITLTGVFMPNTYYMVYFGNVASYANSSSATTIKVNVPFGAVPGAAKISVKYGSNQSADASGDFTVLAPTISSFSPASGVAGTIITISGAGFSTSNTTVKFGTIQSNIISVSDTQIRVAVPSNLNLGAMKITVVSNGQTIVSTDNFTATN